MRSFIYIALFLFICHSSVSQNKKEDSLKKIIATAPNDTTKVKNLLSLANVVMRTKVEESKKYCTEALELAEKIKYLKGIANANNLSAIILFQNGAYAEAIELNRKAIPIQLKIKDDFGLSRSYNNLGNINYMTFNIDSSIHYFVLAAKIAERIQDTTAMKNLYHNLGAVNKEKKNYEKAIEFYFKAMRLNTIVGDRAASADTYVNISNIYVSKGKDTIALKYLDTAFVIYKEFNDSLHYIDIYSNYSTIYEKWGQLERSLANLKMALRYSLSLNIEESIVYCYQSMGETYRNLNDTKEAERYLFMALPLAQKMDLKGCVKSIYRSLYLVYKYKNDYKNAVIYNEKYVAIKDSIDQQVYSEKMLEVETKFDLERKEKEIALLNKDKKVQEAELDKKKGWIGFFIVLIGAFVLLSVIIIRSNVNRKKANKLLSQLNNDLHLSKNEIETQKHIVEEKQKEIIDSINYAKRIQSTLLAHADFLKANIPNNFVLFKPKDIVSGDFYWAAEHGDKFYLAVCDSTGHGVPGAFMSLLNIGFLSEAIKERNITEPHMVFNYVRQRLIDGISRDGQKDGFDGILLCLDKRTKKMSYSAAHNAPIIIRNGEILELQKDKMPVGIGERKESFTLFEIDHKPDDSLYLYTDGYADQFGGPKGKKFLYKRLVDLLKTISPDDIHQRGNKLNLKFEEWKGTLEQVDDVLVIGIKI